MSNKATEFVTCPTCKGVDSITYSFGRPRACSTCNGHGSISKKLFLNVYASQPTFNQNEENEYN